MSVNVHRFSTLEIYENQPEKVKLLCRQRKNAKYGGGASLAPRRRKYLRSPDGVRRGHKLLHQRVSTDWAKQAQLKNLQNLANKIELESIRRLNWECSFEGPRRRIQLKWKICMKLGLGALALSRTSHKSRFYLNFRMKWQKPDKWKWLWSIQKLNGASYHFYDMNRTVLCTTR